MIKDSSGARRLYGIYRGVVFDNKDPDGLNRVRITIPQVFGDSPSGWSWSSGNSGIDLNIPDIGQGVWVTFEGGDPSFPVWFGVFGTEQGSGTKLTLNPVPSGTVLPYNFKLISNNDKNSLDVIATLISVASVIDGGNA
jgi:hypothetical protein